MKRKKLKKSVVLGCLAIVSFIAVVSLNYVFLENSQKKVLEINESLSVSELCNLLHKAESFNDRRNVWDAIQSRVRASETDFDEFLTLLQNDVSIESLGWIESTLTSNKLMSRSVKVAENLKYYNSNKNPRLISIASKFSTSSNGFIGIPCAEALFIYGKKREGLKAILSYARSPRLRTKVTLRLKGLTGHDFALSHDSNIVQIDKQIRLCETWISKNIPATPDNEVDIE